MCSSDNRLKIPANKPEEVRELQEELDFETIVSPNGLITICGFGSLLSERSARITFPDLINFRVARLNGFRRVFAHVAPVFFKRGVARPQTKEVSSLSVEPCEGDSLIVTVFEVKISEIPGFIEREIEFRFLAVLPQTLDGKPFDNPAVLCARYSDEEFFRIRCKGSMDMYFQLYGQYKIDKIWQDDILPCRPYMRHWVFPNSMLLMSPARRRPPPTLKQHYLSLSIFNVLAAKNLGNAVYNNFLDHTFLGDRKTTIREYLATTGSGIMEEEPPELYRTHYSG